MTMKKDIKRSKSVPLEKKYITPSLIDYGKVRELTTGGSQGGTEAQPPPIPPNPQMNMA